MLHTFGTWLNSTSLHSAMAGGYPWLWPACETIHFIGLAMLVGIVGMLDLRMIGMGKGIPIASLQHLMPWGVAGFVLNAITGVLFFAGDPLQYMNNIAFWWKMAFIALAGVNVGAFYVTGLAASVLYDEKHATPQTLAGSLAQAGYPAAPAGTGGGCCGGCCGG